MLSPKMFIFYAKGGKEKEKATSPKQRYKKVRPLDQLPEVLPHCIKYNVRIRDQIRNVACF